MDTVARPILGAPRPTKRKLTPEMENEVCRRYQDGEGAYTLGKHRGVDSTTIYNILKRHGVPTRSAKDRRSLNSRQTNAVVSRYLAGSSCADLAADFQVNESTIERLLAREGIAKRTASEAFRQHHCDHRFFDTVDSEEKAYWLGFIGADGYVNEEHGSIRVALAKRDKEHLYRLKYSLRSTHRVIDYTNYSKYHQRDTTQSTFTIRSAELVAGLVGNGVGGRKTFRMQWPEHLPAALQRHYLRGLVDGDGSFFTSKQQQVTRGPVYGFSLHGNLDITVSARQFLAQELDFPLNKIIKQGNIHSLRYSGRARVSALHHYLYNSATIYMLRKYYALTPPFRD